MFPMKCKQRERWTNVGTKTLRQKRDSIRLTTKRTCNRHTGGEILIRVRAVMFKHSDNILLHAFTGPAFVGKKTRCRAGPKKFNILHNVQRSVTETQKLGR